MTETPAAHRVLLFDGSDRARVTLGDETLDDVQVIPLREGDVEPMDLPARAVLVWPGRDTATVQTETARIEHAELYAARLLGDDGRLEQVRIRVREVRDREAKDPFWSRVFRKKE